MNAKQKRFVEEYLVDLNATQAGTRAGYSEKTAHSIGQRLLKNVEVQKAIQEAMSQRGERTGISADSVLKELSRLGYSDLRGLYKEDGTIHQPFDWPEDLARAISSIEVEELFEGHGADRTWIGYTKKVKFWPKDRALELMGKHLSLFKDVHEHTGKDGNPIEYKNLSELSDEQLDAKLRLYLSKIQNKSSPEKGEV